ncbi:MAG: hypothetical protein ABR555_05885 [Pyrinomonadaceae bacterium]
MTARKSVGYKISDRQSNRSSTAAESILNDGDKVAIGDQLFRFDLLDESLSGAQPTKRQQPRSTAAQPPGNNVCYYLGEL